MKDPRLNLAEKILRQIFGLIKELILKKLVEKTIIAK
jgi:hypothetical protein